MARFFLDEDLPRSAAAALRRAGHTAVHVVDAGLRSQPDSSVFRHAQDEGAVLITADLGFADLRAYPLGSHRGIIIVRMSNRLAVAERNTELVRAVDQLQNEDLRGPLIIVAMGRTRVRRPPSSE